MYFPEDDLVCGPGNYRLQVLSLGLSSGTGSPSSPVIQVSLYSWPAPHRILAGMFFQQQLPNPSVPLYFSIQLSSSFTANTLASRYYALVFAASGPVNWHDAFDTSFGRIPQSGTGVPVASLISMDNGGEKGGMVCEIAHAIVLL